MRWGEGQRGFRLTFILLTLFIPTAVSDDDSCGDDDDDDDVTFVVVVVVALNAFTDRAVGAITVKAVEP